MFSQNNPNLASWILQRPTIMWVAALMDATMIWTRGASQMMVHCPKHDPEEMHHSWQGGLWASVLLSLPQEIHLNVCIHIIKMSVWSERSERDRERKSSFTRNNEEMTRDHTTSPRFRFECLLVVGCHHTSACLLSLLFTCDRPW